MYLYITRSWKRNDERYIPELFDLWYGEEEPKYNNKIYRWERHRKTEHIVELTKQDVRKLLKFVPKQGSCIKLDLNIIVEYYFDKYGELKDFKD